jgi:membrane protein DedA with SNARE-associated domain/membrane-associated phospholipid phosphatase
VTGGLGAAFAVPAAVRPGPLTVAVALSAFTAWRWRRLSNENRALAVAAAVALAVYGSGVVHLPSLEAVIRRIGSTLGPYTYALVGVMAFLETGAFIGLVAPGEFTVMFGGVVAAQGEIRIVPLIGLVWACAVAGDTTSFVLGRRLGREFLLRHGPRVKITRARLEQVEGFFERHGGKTILFGRFIGLVRAMAPFIAGASRMRFRRFIPYDVVSAGVWATTFCLIGYLFWQSFDQVVTIAKRGAFALGAVIAVVVGAIALYRYLRVPANRERARAWVDERSQRPPLRQVMRVLTPLNARVFQPIARRSSGPLRFLWERLTPGELGLELTTLLAVTLVGSYVFAALAIEVGEDQRFVFDGTAFGAAAEFRDGLGIGLAKAVTVLGSPEVAGAVIVVAAAYLLWRRQATEALTLLVGFAATFGAVHMAKAIEARPRPAGGLVEASGSSFPSAHAAYSLAYVAIVLAVGRTLTSFVHRAAWVVFALMLAAAIGLSRVYLHVHYLSDVLAGWALGAAVFAVCGLVALVVAFIRQNPREP